MNNKLKNELIVKDNNMIEGSLSLNTNEYKLILCLLAKIKKDDTEFTEMRLPVKEFKEVLEIKGENSYGRIKEYCSNLATKHISITQTNSPKGIWIPWFAYVKKEVGCVEIKFNELLKGSLLRVSKNFTKYFLKNIISLKSFYAMRIYELLKQYETIGHREIDIQSFRYMLGIANSKYKDFYDIKRKILIPSVKEINEKTDIRINYNEIKEGRKTVKIQFDVSSRTINDEKEDHIIMAFKNLTGQILNKDRLREIISKKGLEVVEFYIENFYKFLRCGNVKEPVKYFYSAVIEEYNIPEETKYFDKNKPIQSTNFEQRKYDDEYFESLYENFKD